MDEERVVNKKAKGKKPKNKIYKNIKKRSLSPKRNFLSQFYMLCRVTARVASAPAAARLRYVRPRWYASGPNQEIVGILIAGAFRFSLFSQGKKRSSALSRKRRTSRPPQLLAQHLQNTRLSKSNRCHSANRGAHSGCCSTCGCELARVLTEAIILHWRTFQHVGIGPGIMRRIEAHLSPHVKRFPFP
jgi:hypothetical protein